MGIDEDLREITAELKKLKTEISEIQHITMKVPVEEYIFHSEHFQTALKQATCIAMQHLGSPRELLRISLPSLKGTVTPDKPFETVINDRELILLAGLKTAYNGKNHALYEMQIADKYSKPFPIDKDTKQVIFLNYYLLQPDYLFRLRQTEGSGTLKFSLIGAAITLWTGL